MAKNYITKGNLTGLAAVILGFLSRPGCSIPFFLALFGMGAAGLVETLLPYRHLFLVVSIVSFTISAWMAFRVVAALSNTLFFVARVMVIVMFLYPLPLLFYR